MSDLELIKEIEQRIIGKPLRMCDLDSLMWGVGGYAALNEQQQLVGLSLKNFNLNDITFLSQFTQLQSLVLANNPNITDLTKLKELKNLTYLSLAGNKITDITTLKEFNTLIYLDLAGNKIINLTALKELKCLEQLDLSYNQITELTSLKELKTLTTLDLHKNKIINLTGLGELKNLVCLDLASNRITELTALKDLKKLTALNLSFNQIRKLPSWMPDFELDIKRDWLEDGLCIQGNPLEFPPPEIIKQGNAAIKAYFESFKTKPTVISSHDFVLEVGYEEGLKLNELKVLFVGDGTAGKTSLSKVLRGETFNPRESQTHGINIDHWQHQDLTLHFWDFGGQETMHATHQFFLSKRSLYILVLDGRKEEDAEYWLKHIESFGGDSPVLIVLNKIDEHPSFDVNRKHLLDKYQGIVGFYKLSCDTQQGLDEFKQAFIKAFDTVEMLQTVWGESWLKVKQALESWQQHTISAGEYRKLCHDQLVTDEQTQDILAQYLNDLGVVVYFADLDLNDTHVLEPRWITEAVYKIINAQQLAIKKGVLCLQELTEILKPITAEDYQYPPEKHRHIIELMKKFELCYALENRDILIPDLLDIQEPEFSFTDKQPLRFRLEYDFLPKSIMPRFIVKRHADIKDTLRWRTGVVLYDKNTDATAIIRADDRERLIDIQVGGKQKRDYFAVIRGTLNDIHASFQKLTITELVPLPDNPTICLEYQELIGYELDGEDNYRVGKLRKVYSVSALLNGIEKKEQRQHGNIYVNGDFLQGEKVAKINQPIERKLTPELEKLNQILKQIADNDDAERYYHFSPKDIYSEESSNEFQKTVNCLRYAKKYGYIHDLKEVRGRAATVIDGLTLTGYEVLNNPEKLITDNYPQASIDMSTQNVNITGSTIHGSVLTAKKIENALNTVQASQADNEIKQLLTALLKQIEELNSKVPDEAIKPIIRNAEDLVREVDSDDPRKDQSLLSLNGIKEAAIKLGDIAKPIIEIAEKISPFLLSFL
jgi:small GTP-binding protein